VNLAHKVKHGLGVQRFHHLVQEQPGIDPGLVVMEHQIGVVDELEFVGAPRAVAAVDPARTLSGIGIAFRSAAESVIVFFAFIVDDAPRASRASGTGRRALGQLGHEHIANLQALLIAVARGESIGVERRIEHG